MIKQYVNLPFQAAKHEGNKVPLTATASGLGDSTLGVSEWWVEPSGTTNTDLKYLAKKARAHVRKKYVTNRKNKFFNTLLLPHVGGDKYKVKCSKKGDKSGAVEIEELETWRKIYFTVHYMNAACLTKFENLEPKILNAYEEAFITLKKKDKIKTLVDEPITIDFGTDHHLTSVWSSKKKKAKTLENKPFHLRVLVVNEVADWINKEYKDNTLGSDTSGLITTIDTETLSPLTDKGRKWLVRAQARKAGTKKWNDIKGAVSKVSDTRIKIDWSATAFATDVSAGNSIEYKIKINALSGLCGYAINNFCVVGINYSDVSVLQTFTHEVGHTVQQTIKKESLHDAAGRRTGSEPNPSWHDDAYGGQGPHCHHNAILIASTLTSSGQEYAPTFGSTLCTMFYRDDAQVDPDGKFCVDCLPRLQRVSLDSKRMRKKGWNAV